MKALLIICAIVLVLQLGTVGLGVVTGDEEGPTRDEIENGNWKPSSIAALFEGLLDPFRPRLDLLWGKDDKLSLVKGASRSVTYANGDKERRVAKFELAGGTGIWIRYQCDLGGDEHECPQIICLCPADQRIDPRDFSTCSERWSKRTHCPPEADGGEIVVYSETGKLQFRALGKDGGVVQQP